MSDSVIRGLFAEVAKADNLTVLQPADWPKPKGYANGILAEGRMVFVGGQIGWDVEGRFPGGGAAQVEQTLRNTLAVLAEAGPGRSTWRA